MQSPFRYYVLSLSPYSFTRLLKGIGTHYLHFLAFPYCFDPCTQSSACCSPSLMQLWLTDVLGMPQCLVYSAVFNMPGSPPSWHTTFLGLHYFPGSPHSLAIPLLELLFLSCPLMLMCPAFHLSPPFLSFSISFPHSSHTNHLVSLATSLWMDVRLLQFFCRACTCIFTCWQDMSARILCRNLKLSVPQAKITVSEPKLAHSTFCYLWNLGEVTTSSSGKLDNNTFPIGLNGLIMSDDVCPAFIRVSDILSMLNKWPHR